MVFGVGYSRNNMLNFENTAHEPGYGLRGDVDRPILPPEAVLYDQAVFRTRELRPPESMFDDPGYNRGLGWTPPASQTHAEDVPARQDCAKKPPVRYENVTIGKHTSTGGAKKKPVNENIGAHSLELPDKIPPPVPQGSRPPDRTLPSGSQELESVRGKPVRYENISIGTQNASRIEIKGSLDSLTLLDFQDEELEELDPDIAACL